MRYFDEDDARLHSQKEIDEGDPFEKASYDKSAPIDYEFLKAEIYDKGPIEVINRRGRFKTRINITPCQIQSCNCGSDIISLTQMSGFTSLSTSIDKEKLLENDSLDAFIYDFHHNPFYYYSSSGERQFVEAEIEKHLGIVPKDVYNGKTSPEEIVATVSEAAKADPWSLHNLQSIFRCLLLQRLEVNHFYRDDFEDELLHRFDKPEKLKEFLQRIYDLGFLTSRMIGEHFIREDIEPLAQKGVAANEAQKKRVHASSKVANQNRHKRIAEMLTHIEDLLEQNPAIGRIGFSQIADLAIEDASRANTKLWSQGKGQRDEYLDEIRADLRYRERYKVLMTKIA